MSGGGLQMVVYLQSSVSGFRRCHQNKTAASVSGLRWHRDIQHLCLRQRTGARQKKFFPFLIIPNVAQRSATGNMLKQIQMKAETMLIQSAAATPTSSTAASFPSVLIHVKWLHMATFCFSCQHFCCSQENFGFSFWWSALLRHFSFHWPNFLTVFT